jgi:hypothetical protein
MRGPFAVHSISAIHPRQGEAARALQSRRPTDGSSVARCPSGDWLTLTIRGGRLGWSSLHANIGIRIVTALPVRAEVIRRRMWVSSIGAVDER